MVLNEKIDAFELHSSIGAAIAPQIGHDTLEMIRISLALVEKMEQSLPELVSKSQVESQGYVEMSEALGGQFPKMAMFFANLENGPDVVQVADSVDRGKRFQISERLHQQSLDQGAPLLLTM